MTILGIILNVIGMVYFWRCATAAFEDNNNSVGWVQICLSAFSGASLAHTLT